MRLTMEKKSRAFALLVLGLSFAALMLAELSPERGAAVMAAYVAPAGWVLLGLSLRRGKTKGMLRLGGALLGWFVVSRFLLGEHYLEDSQEAFRLFFAACITALPFAQVWDEDGRRRGLMVVCWLGALASSLLAWLGIASVLTGRTLTLPLLGSRVYVQGGRLFALEYPNLGACFFLLGLIGTGYLALTLRKKWFIPLALLMGLGLWAGIAFTVSRTVMIQCAAVLAGAAFLLVWRSPLRPAWLRVLAGILAAVAALVLTYMSFTWVVEGVSHFGAQAAEVAETGAAAEIAARPLENDLLTMTGRTDAYRGFFELVKHRPKVLVLGVLNKNLTVELNRYIPHDTLAAFYHAHNAYIQTTLQLGLPGLLFALWCSFLAVRSAVRILLLAPKGRVSAAEGLVSLSCLALLLGAISEVYLFTDQFSMCNFAFMLLLGYALQTEKRLRTEGSGKA